MKKLFMSFMAMLLSGAMCMPAVFADEVQLGTVSDATKDDTLHSGAEKPNAVVKGANTSNVTVIYTGINAKTLGDDITNRPDGYAWLGVKVAPDSSVTDLSKVNVRITYFDDENAFDYITKTGTYQNTVDADNTYYLGINNWRLKGAMEADTYGDGMLRFVLEFDWNNDNKYDQTVTVLVDPSDTTIYDETDTNEDWNNDTYQDVLDSLNPEDPTTSDENTLTDNSTSTITVNKKANLDDVPKTGVVYSVINYLA